MSPDRRIPNFDPDDNNPTPRGQTGILSDAAAEAALLGACLLSTDAIDHALAAGVTQSSFVAAGDHGTIWAGIEAAGSDVVAVANWIAQHYGGETGQLGARLVALQTGTPAISGAPSYARIVVDCQHNRHVDDRLRACLNGQFANWRSIVGELVAEADGWNATTITERFFEDVDAALNGDTLGEPPTIGMRDDGVCGLFYAGQLNNIIGESESGKSLLMQWLVAEQIRDGQHVVFLDFEKDLPSVLERLVQMGAEPVALRERFHYRRREDAWTPGELAQLRAEVEQYQPTLCVLDGVTNAMQLERLSLMDNTEIAKFYGGVPLLLSKTGAAVVCIDHVTKDRKDRAAGGIGGQHKRAGITGSSIEMRIKTPAGRGRTGTGYLYVDKDAPGHMRQHAVDGKVIADVTIHSDGESLTFTISPSTLTPTTTTRASTGLPRLTGYMERVSRVLEGFGEVGQSGRSVCKHTTGGDNFVLAALATLVEEGYVAVTWKGSAKLHTSVKAYREAMDAAINNREPQASDADDLRVEDEPDDYDDEPF